jgi:hypothetical protein
VPAAPSCPLIPTPANTGLGLIEIDSRAAAVTSSVVLPEIDPEVAEINTEPTASVLTSPEFGLTVATPGAEEVHCTLVVKSAVEVSLNVPIAAS